MRLGIHIGLGPRSGGGAATLAFASTPAPTGVSSVGSTVRVPAATMTGGTAPYTETLTYIKNSADRSYIGNTPYYQFVPADQGATYSVRRDIIDSLGATLTHTHSLGTVAATSVTQFVGASQVSIGDSITAGQGLVNFSDRWVNIYAYGLGIANTNTAADVLNLGVSSGVMVNDVGTISGTKLTSPIRDRYLGATNNSVKRFWDQTPSNRRKDSLTIAATVNDIRNIVTAGIPQASIEGDYIETMHGLTYDTSIGYADPTKILIAGIYPVATGNLGNATESAAFGASTMLEMARAARRTAQRFGTRFVDPYSGYRESGQGYMAELGDGVHPSVAGHLILGNLAKAAPVVDTPLSAPTGVIVAAGTDYHSANISWNADTGADQYEVVVLGRWGETFDVRRAWTTTTDLSVPLTGLMQTGVAVYVAARKGHESSPFALANAVLPGPDDGTNGLVFSHFSRQQEGREADTATAIITQDVVAGTTTLQIASGQTTVRPTWNMLLNEVPLIPGNSYRIHYNIASQTSAGAAVSATMQIRGATSWMGSATGAQTILAGTAATSWSGTVDFVFSATTLYVGPLMSGMGVQAKMKINQWKIVAL